MNTHPALARSPFYKKALVCALCIAGNPVLVPFHQAGSNSARRIVDGQFSEILSEEGVVTVPASVFPEFEKLDGQKALCSYELLLESFYDGQANHQDPRWVETANLMLQWSELYPEAIWRVS